MRSTRSLYTRWAKGGATALACLIALWFAWRRLGARALAAIQHRRWEQRHTAAAQLRRTCLAAKNSDAVTTERELLRLENMAAGKAMMAAAPPDLRIQIDRLQNALYSAAKPGPWNGTHLARSLQSAAEAWRKASRQLQSNSAIPPLNP